MGQRIQTVQPETQASPFAQNFLAHLQGLLDNQATGEGPMGLQQEAGTAIRQFVNQQGDFSQFAQPVADVHQRETSRSAADLREAFGGQGQRFGTQLAGAEGQLRADALQDLGAIMSQLRMQQGQQQLQGIGLMGQLGQQNLMPFLQMAQSGILPQEIIAQQNPWLQLGIAGLGGATSFMMPWAQGKAGF